MLSREMSNHRTKERSADPAPPRLVRRGCLFLGSSAAPLPARWPGAGAWWPVWEGDPDTGGQQAGRGWGWGSCRTASLWLLAPAASRRFFFPLGVGWGWVEVTPASFCKSTGPWLYGDSEARTQYVQNDFCTSKVERHPFDKGPFGEGYHRKLRVSFVSKAKAGSWRGA